MSFHISSFYLKDKTNNSFLALSVREVIEIISEGNARDTLTAQCLLPEKITINNTIGTAYDSNSLSVPMHNTESNMSL